MIRESTYDIYIKILISREKAEAKWIFRPKTVFEQLNEMINEHITTTLQEIINRPCVNVSNEQRINL